MTLIKDFFRKHFFGIIGAIFVGCLMVGPQVYFIIKNQTAYKGIYMLEGDAERHYLSREAAYLKFGKVTNPYIKGAQGNPNVPYSEIEGIVAYPSKWFGISIPNLNLIYKFVCPALIFFLFYFLVFKILADRVWAISGAALIVMGGELLSVLGIKNLIFWKYAYDQFAVYARPINPQFSSLFFGAFLIILLSNLENQKKWKKVVLGIILGVSFYVYFYTWSFLLVICGMWFLVSVLKKKIDFSPVWIVVGGIIVGLPALKAFYSSLLHPGYRELSEVAMVHATHKPVIGLVATIATIAFIYLYGFSSVDTIKKNFLLICILATWVVNNQQVITGVNIQSGHYHWYINAPIYIIILITTLHQVCVKYEIGIKTKYVLAGIIFLLSFASATLMQRSSYYFWNETYLNYQDLSVVINSLKQTQDKESVVLANDKASELINLFGGFYIFWSEHAGFYLYSDNRRQYTQNWIVNNPKYYLEDRAPKIDIVVKNNKTDEWIAIDSSWKLIAESGDWQAFQVVR